jgi:hypothetical protein
MSEYIKISDVIKICRSLYSSYGTTAFFNVPVFEDLLKTVAVEFPELPEVTWVSICDDLPPKDTTVLVLDVLGRLYFDKWRGNGWRLSRCGNVKFWMSIPEPPVEMTEGEQQ